MKKYIVTAYYIDQYQLDFDPAEGSGFWIKWGRLYKQSETSDEMMTFEAVVVSDQKYPDKVDVRYDEAIFNDSE